MKKEEIHLDDIRRIFFGTSLPEFLPEVFVRTFILYMMYLCNGFNWVSFRGIKTERIIPEKTSMLIKNGVPRLKRPRLSAFSGDDTGMAGSGSGSYRVCSSCGTIADIPFTQCKNCSHREWAKLNCDTYEK
jgi:hypothetical protein